MNSIFFFFYRYLHTLFLQVVHAYFAAEEWVDHAMSKTHETKNQLELSKQAHAD